MKKNVFLLLTTLLFFTAAHAQAEEWWPEEIWCCEDVCCVEDSCFVDETDFYAKIFAGANFLQNTKTNRNKATYQSGYILAASLGYSWCYGLRVEGEYAYRRNKIKNAHLFGQGSSKHGHFQTSSWMANLLWDIPADLWGSAFCDLQSFIGVGIGYDYQHMHATNCQVVFSQKWNHFSWQLMAGLTYPIFCNTDMVLEYKFHQGGCHFNNHSLGVGFIYKFDFFGL